MNPLELIELGKNISEDENYNPEPRFRTAINRIYYGIIHYITIVKQIHIIDPKRFHSDFISKLSDIDHILATQVFNIKDYRETADYYLNQPITIIQVNNVIKIYNRIMEKLETNSSS